MQNKKRVTDFKEDSENFFQNESLTEHNNRINDLNNGTRKLKNIDWNFNSKMVRIKKEKTRLKNKLARKARKV